MAVRTVAFGRHSAGQITFAGAHTCPVRQAPCPTGHMVSLPSPEGRTLRQDHLVDDVNDAIRCVDVRVLDMGHLLGGADVHARQKMMV